MTTCALLHDRLMWFINVWCTDVRVLLKLVCCYEWHKCPSGRQVCLFTSSLYQNLALALAKICLFLQIWLYWGLHILVTVASVQKIIFSLTYWLIDLIINWTELMITHGLLISADWLCAVWSLKGSQKLFASNIFFWLQ